MQPFLAVRNTLIAWAQIRSSAPLNFIEVICPTEGSIYVARCDLANGNTRTEPSRAESVAKTEATEPTVISRYRNCITPIK